MLSLITSRDKFVRLEKVGKSYRYEAGMLEVLRNVSFDVPDRQFISILGPSGCGKSTLLMMLAGLEPVSNGMIEIAGETVLRPRRDVGVIFQDPTLLPWKTALENVLFPIEIYRLPYYQYKARAEALLEVVGLADAGQKKPSHLSGGMRQRVAICRALIHEPRVLLMDEPFSALDAITRDELNVTLLDIWERHHQTAFFVTHSIREAVFLSDRVIVLGLRPGQIVADVPIVFKRPRDLDIGETVDFNEICRMLRNAIATSHTSPSQRNHSSDTQTRV
jgi:NitT/TauT family transport system ATP-binding protein